LVTCDSSPFEEDLLQKFFYKLTGWQRILLLLVSSLMALQPALAQTRETLEFVGTSQLDAVAATGIPADDLHVSPHPESDAELAGINKGPGSASIPVISTPQRIAPAANVTLAIAGLTHRDQRFAGTGSYANTQFSTEPPDEGLAVGNGFVLQTVNAALAVYDANTGALRQGA